MTPTSAQIRQARGSLGRSQKTMATLLGVSFVTYNRWENGHATPSIKHHAKLNKLVNLAGQRRKG